MSKKVSGSERWPMVAGGGDIRERSRTVRLGVASIELVVWCRLLSLRCIYGPKNGGWKKGSVVGWG
ncbi:hypothetical protein HanPI659440_Chr17g0671411 [Helianthus annuus]|nr:hypothetical protein HanPI659440_Chr17g0671411 [Helianthus annuus]